MKWLKGLAITIVALFVIVPLLVLALVGTTTGSKWTLDVALNWALDANSTEVRYDTLSGRLIDNLELTGVVVDSEGLEVAIKQAEIRWRPFDLFNNELTVDRLSLQQVQITRKAAPSTDPDSSIELPHLELPIGVYVKQLSISEVWLAASTEASPQRIVSTFQTTIDWRAMQLQIENFRVTREQSLLHGSGQITTTDNYAIELQADYQLAVDYHAVNARRIDGNLTIGGELSGRPLQVTSEFTTAQTPTQRLTATVTAPLAQLQWRAELDLERLPLTLFSGLIEQNVPQLQSLVNESTKLSAEVSVTSEQAVISKLELSGIGAKQGILQLNGKWRHRNFATDYASSPFDLTASYRDLDLTQLAQRAETETLELVEGVIDLEGTPDAYQFEMINQLLYANTETDRERRAELVTNGTGNLNKVSLSTLKANSEELTFTATAELAWSPKLELRLDIKDGTAVVETDAQRTDIELAGGLFFTENVLTADGLTLAIGESRLQLNGSTAGDQRVTGELRLGALEELPLLPAAVTELESLTLNFSLDANEQLNLLKLNVETLAVTTESIGSWSTSEMSQFEFAKQSYGWQLTNTDLCLHHDGDRLGAICQRLEADADKVSMSITGKQLSLWLLNRLRKQDVAQRIAGTVDVEAHAKLDRQSFKLVAINAQVSSDDTTFFALDQDMKTQLEQWQLIAKGDPNQIYATLDGTLTDGQGGLIGEVKVSDLYGAQDIQGELIFQLDDLAMLDWVLPGLRYEGGRATASLQLQGTMAAPTLEGDMEVYAETVGFAQTNLVFNEVRLALIDAPDTQGELQIEGQARSGDQGWLLLEGLAIPLEQEAFLAIEGQNFRALQMPIATVDVSPNIRIHLKDQLIDIAGTVDVPYAQITAPEFENAVARSPDVVVTKNGEAVAGSSNTLGGLKVQAAVRVNLSDNVSVNAYGFEGKLAGSLEVVEQPRRPLTGVGSINVTEGLYTIYGQELAIDRGAFIYNGGDISNPGLNLRVKREINNTTAARNVSVGAQVGGTLTEPSFNLFSTPAMPDSEVLSYLLLGRSMQSAASTGSGDLQLQALLMLGAKGTEAIGESLQDTFGFDEFGIDSNSATRETSFYIGKYLSPKLYVKYGIGLLDSTNTFLVRYQLTERLLIETMTSTKSQGGDIFYTFEKE
ncbi:Translocation and assembly module TamB [Pseudidiomarina piscicola]|uniref:Translocation and assembly module TamB n=1 Tax=Pseudidiomarina piscicola TaxID=2614830 RepID=A0A6S6WMD3_9GAMM|nr:translocation/assembly module TamB domain-containing protein [Pseudidiomarina piscicola]CAB0151992.1 Translocation and assembly module TamB [Pseudidiomarina piscicola]VZT41430.1 Translocation and assembly module TamB [Pseudomonas aeruginosa]